MFGIQLAFTAPKGVCQDNGGVELDAADCVEICCMLTDGVDIRGVVMSAATCAQFGGVVAGNPGLCGDTVCCEIPGGFLGIDFSGKLSQGLCEETGTVVDDAECGDVCCLVGDGFSTEGKVMSKSACENNGGTITDDAADCEETVCCGTSALGFSVAGNLPTSECEQMGGSVLDAAQCASICCAMNGKSAVTPTWVCELMGGTNAGDPAECEVLFCCSVSGADAVAGMLPHSICDSIGTFLEAADCENVCCIVGGADPEVLMKAVCVEKGGVPTGDPEDCEGVVCCNVNLLGVSISALKPQSECVGDGEVVDTENCDEVCCMFSGNDGVSAKKTTKAGCADSGGIEAGPGDDCDDLVCCSISGFGVTGAVMAPAAKCDQIGSVEDASECENTCCVIGGENGTTSKTMTKAMCDQFGFDAGPDVDCDDLVCCSMSGIGMSFSVTIPAETCSSKGGTAVDASECEVVCCVSVSGDTKKTTKAACAGSGGAAMGSGEDCDDLVCCHVSGFGISAAVIMPAAKCGSLADASECAKTCCLVNNRSVVVMKSVCEMIGGLDVGADVDCDDLVCCSVGGYFISGLLVTIPAATCSSQGGFPVDASECEETCCIHSDGSGDQVAEHTSKAYCDQVGGYDAGPDVNCKVKVCCGFSALGMDIATMLPIVTCDEFGVVLEDESCNLICCILPEGGMLITSVYVCTLYGGTAGSWDDCNNDNNCYTPSDCDEAPVCKEASCPAGTCVYENLSDGTPCDDGDPDTPSSECVQGTCVCVPDCENKDCGPDGCGGICGPCPPGLTCVGTDCVESTGQPCDPPSSGYSGDVVEQAHVAFSPTACTCSAGSGYAGLDSLVLDFITGSTSGGGSPEPPWTILQTVPDVGSGAWLSNLPLDTPITFWLKHNDTGVVVKITVTLTTTGISSASIECV